MSYGYYLPKVGADTDLIDLGGSVGHIRRTPKRYLLFELNTTSESSADSFHDQVENVLGE